MMNIDITVTEFFNHALSSNFTNVMMTLASCFGGGEAYFLLGLGLLLFAKKAEYRMLGLSILAGLTVSHYIVSALKVFVSRPRPFAVLPNIILLGGMEKSHSFPSSHASMAFFMATVLCAKFRRYAAPLFALAALIGVSRVYMGVHYASDVIAGALIGIAIGYVLVKVSGRILSPQSALRPRSLIG